MYYLLNKNVDFIYASTLVSSKKSCLEAKKHIIINNKMDSSFPYLSQVNNIVTVLTLRESSVSAQSFHFAFNAKMTRTHLNVCYAR